jgi:RNA polymerase sigma factor (sigma-70 family)
VFPSTRHTLLQQASDPGEHHRDALNAVMEIYWQPCYRYVVLRFRRPHEEAQDLVQGFFTAFVEQAILARYDPVRGPFRPYLRACLDQFVLKDLERNRCEKRGGQATVVPLDPDAPIAQPEGTPEELFHREWQRHMFALASEDLRKLCDETDRAVRYRLFVAYDLADGPRPRYDDLAATHGLPVTTVTNHLAWARRELRRLLEDRVGTIASGEGERRRELRSLLSDKPS